jgi:hypothetical protein
VGAPDFLTVEEAARILRIGRTAAYLAAKRFRETNGAEGLPVVAIRGSLRVPRRKLEQLAGGPIGLASPPTDAGAPSPQMTSTRRTRRDVDQARLPFSA